MGWLVAVASACGAPHVEPVGPLYPGAASVSRQRDIRVATLTRATGEALDLSLWIDAGSHHATPPQLAAATALTLSKANGLLAAPIVTPSATAFRQRCQRTDIERCLERFAGILGHRGIEPAATRWAMGRIRMWRRAASADATREVTQRALGAMAAHSIKGLDPLGRASQDRDVNAEMVTTFARQHYGTNRAIVIGVGALDHAEFARRVADTSADLPIARERPKGFYLRTVQDRTVIYPARHRSWGMVMTARSLTNGQAMLERAERLKTMMPALRSTQLHLFPLGPRVLLTATGLLGDEAQAWSARTALLLELGWMQAEGSEPRSEGPPRGETAAQGGAANSAAPAGGGSRADRSRSEEAGRWMGRNARTKRRRCT